MAEQLEEVVVTAKADQSLQAFMRQDFLKSSQFMFMMPNLPFDVGLLTGKNPRGFSMFCESVEFPGKNVQATDYKIAGYNRIRVPYSREYPEVTLTFIHNIDVPVYDIFSYWVDFISNEFTSVNNRYFNEIVTDFTLLQYSEFPDAPYQRFGGLSSILNSIDKINRNLLDSNRLFKVTDIAQQFINNLTNVSGLNYSKQPYYLVSFKDAYPLSFASMPSNWSDEGFHRLSVTFTYESYVVNPASKTDLPVKRQKNDGFNVVPSIDEVLDNYLPG